ncbi:MAG: IclR family transcriptional regulator [SAR324 cluster bacterium]|nr:IclR family transcriptional regulator [SAR324 cluster bacterium]
MQQKQNTHQSVERSLEILMAFVPDNPELGVTEVSKLVGLHRSTVSRLLQVLTRNGFLQQNPITKNFSLGKSASEIGRAVISTLETRLTAISKPHIDALRDIVEENVALEELSGSSTILTYTAKSRGMLQVSFRIGDRLPVHVAAGAKAILAFLPADLRERFIPEKLESFTVNTITDREKLMQQLLEIRESGFSFDRGERDPYVHVVATPVFNDEKKPVAAVVVSVPSMRKDTLIEEDLLNQLKTTSSAISAELMY